MATGMQRTAPWKTTRSGGFPASLPAPPVVDEGISWVRPADWLELPAVEVGDQRFVGLVAVFPGDANFVTISATGNYTVDWGDGSTPQNVATGVTVEHNIAYADVSDLTTRGYRQAIVTVTPQAGQSLTELYTIEAWVGAPEGSSTPWLDIKIAGAALANLGISMDLVPARLLEQFEFVGPSLLEQMGSVFYNASSLQSVIGTEWTAGMTIYSYAFANCTSLRTVPLFDTGACTNFDAMFLGCYSLQEIPLLDTSAGTNFGQMFDGCRSLLSVPPLDTAVGGNFATMFGGCSALKTIPLLDVGAGTNFFRMLMNCTVLQAVPLLDTAAGTNFEAMLSGCKALQSVPLLDTAAGANFASMFQNCLALQAVPPLNTAAAIGDFLLYAMFGGCPSLQTGALAGSAMSIDYSNCKLSGAALDAIYTGLASGVVAQTITVIGNWGVGDDDPTIATNKGWTVVAA